MVLLDHHFLETTNAASISWEDISEPINEDLEMAFKYLKACAVSRAAESEPESESAKFLPTPTPARMCWLQHGPGICHFYFYRAPAPVTQIGTAT